MLGSAFHLCSDSGVTLAPALTGLLAVFGAHIRLEALPRAVIGALKPVILAQLVEEELWAVHKPHAGFARHDHSCVTAVAGRSNLCLGGTAWNIVVSQWERPRIVAECLGGSCSSVMHHKDVTGAS